MRKPHVLLFAAVFISACDRRSSPETEARTPLVTCTNGVGIGCGGGGPPADTGVADAADGGTTDAAIADGADGGTSDAADTGLHDADASDAIGSDAADAGTEDADPSDATASDDATDDAGSDDAQPYDGPGPDAPAPYDAGFADATPDAGPLDSGPPPSCATEVSLSMQELDALDPIGTYNVAFTVDPTCQDDIYVRDTHDLVDGDYWMPPNDDYPRYWRYVMDPQANLQWIQISPNPQKLVLSWDGDIVWAIDFRYSGAPPPYQEFIFDLMTPGTPAGCCTEDDSWSCCSKP
jgi:hypothetical protein